MDSTSTTTQRPQPSEFDTILFSLSHVAVSEAVERLSRLPTLRAAEALVHLNQARARELLAALPVPTRAAILAVAPADYQTLWSEKVAYPANSIGELMRPPVGVMRASAPMTEAIAALRALQGREMITYLYAVDGAGRLEGVVVLRDLFLHLGGGVLADVMIRPPFYLTPEMTLLEAMRATVSRHYPVYPVCDAERRLVGLVRGQALFERQVVTIGAQQAAMVGVRPQESLATPWRQSLRFRHPWLQLSLLAGLLPAVVVASFQGAISRLVVLAVFAPLVAHQARNAGAQTMAVTLRGLNTGEWEPKRQWRVLLRESSLAALHGSITGVFAGLLMAFLARRTGHDPFELIAVTTIGMGVGCAMGSLFGVLVPLALLRLRADPAHAAAIVLSAFVSSVSQLVYLGLAAWWLP